MPAHAKATEHSLQFKSATTIRSLLNKGGDSVKAFTHVAIAQEITIGPFNTAPIAAMNLIGNKLGRLTPRSATSSNEIKARTAELYNALLLFLDKSIPNGRKSYASLMAKESYTILEVEELVTIPGKQDIWTGSKEI